MKTHRHWIGLIFLLSLSACEKINMSYTWSMEDQTEYGKLKTEFTLPFKTESAYLSCDSTVHQIPFKIELSMVVPDSTDYFRLAIGGLAYIQLEQSEWKQGGSAMNLSPMRYTALLDGRLVNIFQYQFGVRAFPPQTQLQGVLQGFIEVDSLLEVTPFFNSFYFTSPFRRERIGWNYPYSKAYVIRK